MQENREFLTRILADALLGGRSGDSMKRLRGATVRLQMYKWSVCQALADAMELRAWDIVCAEPLSEERKPQDKEES